MSVEEEFMDVLQNIEFSIINVYRAHPEMTDSEAEFGLAAVLRQYQAESRGRTPTSRALPGLSQEVFEGVKAMCDWRLGRNTILTGDDEPFTEGPPPIALADMIACLKRIRKSIKFWSKEGGRRGYLDYVSRFIG
ncbi:MAG: hypothetical protein ACE5H9_02865 [Anaerolineae bacterium]